MTTEIESTDAVPANEVAATADQPDARSADLPDVRDWFLVNLVEMAERGIEQHIVLDIGGSHLSGLLIGGWRYFDKLAAAARPAEQDGPRTLGHDIANLYETMRDDYSDPDEDRDYPPLGDRDISYIHLSDARWYDNSARSLPTNGTLWRGKLTAVDGFWIGSITLSPAN